MQPAWERWQFRRYPGVMAHRNVEEEIEALNRLREAPPAEAVPALRKALADRVNLIVAKAARIAAERQLRDFLPDLLLAFDRLFEKPAARDPQCWGKNAISKALVALDHRQADPFLRGLRHVQLEPVWGGQEDTAATLRGTCALALPACADIERGLVLRHLVDSLADPAVTVRSDVLRALGNMEGDEAILVLRLKARMGDEDSQIVGQVFDHLLQLEGRQALDFVTGFLLNKAETVREEAALSLGSSRLPEAVERLTAAWDRERDLQFRLVLLRALSATRQPHALEFLLNLLRIGRIADAAAAVEALALHRDSPDIRRQVEEAARLREPEVRQQLRQCFARAENA
jgi:HEAT repeat protein